jgi:hypothetical protein
VLYYVLRRMVMGALDEKTRMILRAPRALLRRLSPARDILNVYCSQKKTHWSEVHGRSFTLEAKCLSCHCSDGAVFRGRSRKDEMEKVLNADRIVYSKRPLPEKYPTVVRAQRWRGRTELHGRKYSNR